MSNPTVRYMCSTGRTLSFFPTSLFFSFLRRALRSVRKAWFSVCLQIGPPLVRLASERFFRARSRPGPTGGHLPQRKLHCSPPPEKQKIRESQAENTCIDSGLMTKADDGSSGRSRMMRKSHVRFPEKGVATYWSFDQPPPVNSALGPPLTLPLL